MFDLEISIFRAKSYPTWRILKLSDRWKIVFWCFFCRPRSLCWTTSCLEWMVLARENRCRIPRKCCRSSEWFEHRQRWKSSRRCRCFSSANCCRKLIIPWNIKIYIDFYMDFCREWCFSPGNLDEKNVISQSQPARRCEKHVAAGLRGDR